MNNKKPPADKAGGFSREAYLEADRTLPQWRGGTPPYPRADKLAAAALGFAAAATVVAAEQAAAAAAVAVATLTMAPIAATAMATTVATASRFHAAARALLGHAAARLIPAARGLGAAADVAAAAVVATEQAAATIAAVAAATIAMATVAAAAMAAVVAATSHVFATGVVAAAAIAAAADHIQDRAIQPFKCKRLGCDTHQADGQCRHEGTILHGRAPQNGTYGDGNGNNMSPEPPAPRCSRVRQAETLSFSDQVSFR